MADNVTRSRGTPGNYKSNRGGIPNEPGPWIGIVKNNHDPARIGRVQVYIPEFSTGQTDEDENDSTLWRTVRYMSPFFGSTPHAGSSEGVGTSEAGNPNSYGMWFTVPDVDTKIMCFFVGGDPNQGYYMGCIPDPDAMHMVPAIGAQSTDRVQFETQEQQMRYEFAERVPVAEINTKNRELTEDPQSYNQTRPIHTWAAGLLYQQGLIEDTVRGPISSSAYRESPSHVFGISTPGRKIHSADITEYNIQQALASGGATKEDFKVVGRRPGHSFVMDDGDITGNDQLMRFRTAKGHQILMSDDGNCVHIIHANGQSWVELGKEGTVDVYAANSINLRTQGDLNLHADQDLNLYAGRNLNLHGKESAQLESDKTLNLVGEQNLSIASKKKLSLLSDGTVAIDGTKGTSLNADGKCIINGSTVELNTAGKIAGTGAQRIAKTKLGDVDHHPGGWSWFEGTLDSIVSRAPTHEPYEEHGLGVQASVNYDAGATASTSDSVTDKLSEVESNIGVTK
jgi:hypothetical protein